MRRRKMSTFTWVELYWGRLGLLLLVLAGTVWADTAVTINATTESSQYTGSEATSAILSSICPVRSWREIQAESLQFPTCFETRWGRGKVLLDGQEASDEIRTADQNVVTSTISTGSTTSSGTTGQIPTDTGTDQELDTDSPLDNANFLSFEDWKKQNLARVGQSAENVGRHRQGVAAGGEGRRRPAGINNALDSLGEDAEIELEFGGFGAEAPENAEPTAWGTRMSSDGEAGRSQGDQGTVGDAAAEDVSRRGTARRKDAGTTCKERFNYASFDCAATVLKTNPQCTGSSSVLIENKDSYMLNECRAKDKFLILELCDDILIDTIVLANYEFFSSIFRTFRVSVSDRYPAKEWKEVGVYEARNTREVQAFAVENPLIWARYVKIEFLTHYGNEFYCPVSLVRVHGTTMLEEYKHDGEIGRTDDDLAEDVVEKAQVAPDSQTEQTEDATRTDEAVASHENATDATIVQHISVTDTCPLNRTEVEEAMLHGPATPTDICTVDEAPLPPVGPESSDRPLHARSVTVNTTSTAVDSSDGTSTVEDPSKKAEETQKKSDQAETNVTSSSDVSAQTESSEQNTRPETESRPTITTPKEEQSAAPEPPVKPSVIQPPSANPTTQESFFKSVNKRLQMLESNSSLSLLYIEEQSRILRDAFNKVEKRQLAKTTTFLENLNATVLNELKEFREQYDHVWKSVVVEFEHQRIQYHQEFYSMTAQLGVLADELVFQKRISIIQSIFVLICFGLVLFSRGAVGTYIEFPSVQNMVSRSYSLRSSSPPFESPSASPTSTRPTSSYHGKGRHRRNDSEDSQAGPMSPTIAYSPATPSSEAASRSDADEKMDRLTPESSRVPTPDPPGFRSGSSPPTLSGRSGDVDEDEIVESARMLKPSDMRRAPS